MGSESYFADSVAVVITAPRIVSTLSVTIASLSGAGWDNVIVRHDGLASGPSRNWIEALRAASSLGTSPILICEDDIVMSRRTREWLATERHPQGGILSLYTSGANHCDVPGWNEVTDRRKMEGALAYFIDGRIAKAICSYDVESTRETDLSIARFCIQNSIPYWCHSPSLVKHIGCGLSTVDDDELSRPAERRNCRWFVPNIVDFYAENRSVVKSFLM